MRLAAIPLSYNLRNLWLRKTSTAITAFAIALVVLVIELNMTLVSTVNRTFAPMGKQGTLVVTSRDSDSEIVSRISIDQVEALRSLPSIGVDSREHPLFSPEISSQFTFEQKDGQFQDALVRGVSEDTFSLQPAVRIKQGANLTFNGNEAIVGASIQQNFKKMKVGDYLTMNHRRFQIRGIFEAMGTSLDSEIWIPRQDLMDVLNWRWYSTVRIGVAPGADPNLLIKRIQNDPQLQLQVESEPQFFARQFNQAGDVRRMVIIGAMLCGPAAALAAMIAMYGTIAARTTEIGTIRAIGFPPGSILASFLVEAALLGTVAAVIASPVASQFSRLTYAGGAGISFRIVVLHFQPTLAILLGGALISVCLTVIGGMMPARWASKMTVIDAIRNSSS